MSETAVVIRARGISHCDQFYPCGAVIRDLAQFDDWQALGLVARATPEQIAAADKAEAEARAAAEKAAKSKASKTA